MRPSILSAWTPSSASAGTSSIRQRSLELNTKVPRSSVCTGKNWPGRFSSSIRQLQRHGLADTDLDPAVAAAALGAMTYRFAEYWLAHGGIDCDFEVGVDTVTRLFVNALGLDAA
jgi:hypothetical protein